MSTDNLAERWRPVSVMPKGCFKTRHSHGLSGGNSDVRLNRIGPTRHVFLPENLLSGEYVVDSYRYIGAVTAHRE